MASPSLTVASSLQCPHGGTVTIATSNARTSAAGSPAALATDAFTIAGCPFQIPIGTGTVPSPCVRVQWIVSDMRDRTGTGAGLTQASAGLCLAATQVPQGAVVVVATQPTASAT